MAFSYLNWADWAILVILLVSSLISLKRGFVKEALSVICWILAFFVATTFKAPFSLFLAPYIETPSLRELAAFAILFALTLIVGALVNYLIGTLVKITGLSGTDRLLGMLFGFLRGFIIVMAILLLVPAIAPVDQDQWWRDSVLIPHFLEFEGWCRSAAKEFVSFMSHLMGGSSSEAPSKMI